MKRFFLAAFTAVLCSVIISAGLAIKSQNDLEKLRSTNIGFAKYVPVPECHIEVGPARIATRTKAGKEDRYVTVDVNARCDQFQKNSLITLEIWKEGKYFPHRVAKFQNDPMDPSFSGHKVSLLNFGVSCKDSTITNYYGIASVKALIGGKHKETPQVTSFLPSSLHCGS